MSADAGLLAVAEEAARAAGALLADRFRAGVEVALQSKSSPTDLVSQADVDAENLIRMLLAERRPDDAVMGEEGADTGGTSGLRWVIDPLDGTIDFLYGMPQWAVSVAVEDAAGNALAGAVFDPLRGELFAATADGTPTLDGARIRPRGPVPLGQALVATGFAYGADVRAEQARVLVGVLPRVRDIRRCGSAALDLSWTAAGRFDAYFERGPKRWDVAAGALICERAGLVVETLAPTAVVPAGILVAPAQLIDELRGLLG